MKEFFTKKVFSLTFTNLLFLAIGLMMAISVSVAYATWNDAKTGGSGKLSEDNWNALVNMLETSDGGRPGNWVCSTVMSGTVGWTSSVTCPVGTNLITGGCEIGALGAYIADFGYPLENGWNCSIFSGGSIRAYARCCR